MKNRRNVYMCVVVLAEKPTDVVTALCAICALLHGLLLLLLLAKTHLNKCCVAAVLRCC